MNSTATCLLEARVNPQAVLVCDRVDIRMQGLTQELLARVADGVAEALVVAVHAHRKGVAKGGLTVDAYIAHAGWRP